MASSSNTLPYAFERSIAISAVLKASQLTSRVFDTLVASSDSLTKSDKSPVTVGDFGAQAVVNSILGKHFPQDPIVGEEDSADLRDGKGAGLKDQVCKLAKEAFKPAVKECPALKEEDTKQEEDEITDDQLLDAIDRGNHEGGSKGRE